MRAFTKRLKLVFPHRGINSEYCFLKHRFISLFLESDCVTLVGPHPEYLQLNTVGLKQLNLSFLVGNHLLLSSLKLTPDFKPYIIIYKGKILPYDDYFLFSNLFPELPTLSFLPSSLLSVQQKIIDTLLHHIITLLTINVYSKKT